MEVQLALLLESKREIRVYGLQEAAAVGGRMDVQHAFLYFRNAGDF
jgi:hypothetical protein